MKSLTILVNDVDDCLLYVDGRASDDIDDRFALGLWELRDRFTDRIVLIKTKLKRIDFPDRLDSQKYKIEEKISTSATKELWLNNKNI